MTNQLQALANSLSGELHYNDLMRRLYATDASVYRQLPLAVALPKTKDDLKLLVAFANNHQLGLIPRTAGTSLAGQCVGDGIVVDFSKYFNQILEFNPNDKTVTVQPGVVRDELNNFLKPHNLFFGPNTSTSNRCMIGGMVGNNSSGTTSIKYGVTRDKLLKLKVVLSDGSEAEFKNVTPSELKVKLQENSLEANIYTGLLKELESKNIQKTITDAYPKASIHRRNTGYAIDELIKQQPFSNSGKDLNLSTLVSGSEGTLALSTEITLKLDDLPPKLEALVAFHFNSIESCLSAVVPMMQHNLFSCEMMDDTILNLTKHNKAQQANREFIIGAPKAILMCELRASEHNDLKQQIEALVSDPKLVDYPYTQAILYDNDIVKAMELRKAGLGLLGNMIGDKKAVACIEDTAVAIEDLSAYIKEFTALMTSFKQTAVYYAHAGAGELHLRPILNLKKSSDVKSFRTITSEVAQLVKRYNGSFSGEHGDGIVRAEFIPQMIGEDNYKILERIKFLFDPNTIFNPGKIISAKRMDENLRYVPDRQEPQIETLLDFSESKGVLREAEKCNGSGDCRKLPEFGGTMCPSYRATRNEKDTTRARANALREYLTNSDKQNKFDHSELKEVFKLCLSCKACKTECPSSVDVSALKAEFEYQYQKTNGVSLRTKAFAFNNKINKVLSPFSPLVNFVYQARLSSSLIKRTLGINSNRSLPLISSNTLSKYLKINNNKGYGETIKSIVYLFIDEFSNYLDSKLGRDTVDLLSALGYNVRFVRNEESGRALISKGLLKEAKIVANKNVHLFKDIISKDTPLIGIEPSAILSFKDEYLKLADDKKSAELIAKNTFLIEEFLQKEIEAGRISTNQFSSEPKLIKFHGHCHQKALSTQKSSFDVLNLPINYKVTIIPSGCCGMAGSFGYEKENYEVSMAIGNQTLFPAIRKAAEDTIIAANGTSCRHQIKDGTGVKALHPISILKQALL